MHDSATRQFGTEIARQGMVRDLVEAARHGTATQCDTDRARRATEVPSCIVAGRVLAKWLKDVPKPRTRLHALRELAGV
jgi:hypothetical protein